MFILGAAAVVGSITAIAAVGNLIFSGMNLRQQRELDDRRAQDDALQNYFQQMGELLTTHKLKGTEKIDDSLRLLARAYTLTVLLSVEGAKRKTAVALFLDGVGLINKPDPIVSLRQADLADADLSNAELSDADLSRVSLGNAYLNDANLSRASLKGADLKDAFIARTDLSGADLSGADLRRAILSDANLSGVSLNDADLREADLIDANLSGADLSGALLEGAFLNRALLNGAKVEQSQLEQAENLTGVRMHDGTKHP